ncbi:hypothetical protein Q8A67_021582 [Cirrhinus molitorella]|uniref:Uncharacterized protein n=1 Tax=Cirrhinus molitorella TaxID=172907 RepID=A0AA88PA37_9TELE|nr:hypothetical protein Q8A67_021582 [Cirrhinus molitorella]
MDDVVGSRTWSDSLGSGSGTIVCSITPDDDGLTSGGLAIWSTGTFPGGPLASVGRPSQNTHSKEGESLACFINEDHLCRGTVKERKREGKDRKKMERERRGSVERELRELSREVWGLN